MQTPNFEDILNQVTSQDSRYHRDAYLFLREALDHTQKRLSQPKKPEPQHVTPKELLEGLREYALNQFGPMTKMVLNEWGIRRCEDFGELVFNLVDQGLLSKTEDDSREGFKGGYDFEEAFCKPFRPGPRQAVSTSSPTKANPS
jgi:uncharacterized repeat protein (TIGR04138 family)